MSPSSKSARFIQLLSKFREPAPSRGRKPEAFATEPDGGTRFPASRNAYAQRLHHFKILIAVDRDFQCADPHTETSGCIGSVRRTLWLYAYDCLPGFSEKERILADLLATHSSNMLIKGLEAAIMARLIGGMPSDMSYGALLLDDDRMLAFANEWFRRPNKHPGRRGGN
jgi:hypothetical protein